MALIKCSECAAEISSAATACPKCGAPTRRPKGKFAIGCVSIIVVVFLIGVVGSFSNHTNTGTSASSSSTLDDMCKSTPDQRKAAQSMIQLNGYDCSTVDAMCPYVLSEGFDVFCNNKRYRFQIENHGGKWSVKAD